MWHPIRRAKAGSIPPVIDERGEAQYCAPIVRDSDRFKYKHPIPDDSIAVVLHLIRGDVSLTRAWMAMGLICTPMAATHQILQATSHSVPDWLIIVCPAAGFLATYVYSRRIWSEFYTRYPATHKRVLLQAGFCPWCCRTLRELVPDAAQRVTCADCGGVWKLPIVRAGGSENSANVQRLNREHHLVTNIAVALGLAALATVTALIAVRTTLVAAIVGTLLILIAWLCLARARVVVPLIAFASSFMPFVFVTVYTVLMKSSTPASVLLTVGAAFSSIVFLLAWWSSQPEERLIRKGIGTKCATCGFDLIKTPDHERCPECGGTDRMTST